MRQSTNHWMSFHTGLIAVFLLTIMAGVSTSWGAGSGKGNNAQTFQGSNKSPLEQESGYTLLPGTRVITGTVEAVMENEAKVDSGETGEISPRYVSLERAREKGFTLKKGDTIEMAVDAKNLVVDYHLKDGKIQSHHTVIKGTLAQPLPVGQEHAMIKTQDGKVQTFPVRPLARSEVAAIPFDTEALFLLDETHKIAGATLTKDVVADRDWDRSSAYNVYRHVGGTVQDIPDSQTVTIQTSDNKTISLPVWGYLKKDVANLSKGQKVTLLIDGQDKVVDIASLGEKQK